MEALPLEVRAASRTSNRAWPDPIKIFLRGFVRFYSPSIARAGKSPTSPAVRFVVAAAVPPLEALNWDWGAEPKNAVSHFIRMGVEEWWPVDLAVLPPEVGDPTLSINRPPGDEGL